MCGSVWKLESPTLVYISLHSITLLSLVWRHEEALLHHDAGW